MKGPNEIKVLKSTVKDSQYDMNRRRSEGDAEEGNLER